VKHMKELAWSKSRREIGTFTYSYAVVRDTEKEAREYYNYYVNEKGDWEAADAVCKIYGMESGSYPREYFDHFRAAFIRRLGRLPADCIMRASNKALMPTHAKGMDMSITIMVGKAFQAAA
jgi:FMNH2-dependent dimethyl sulfone monooxygenase